MNKPLIKICGITDPAMAKAAALAGADFIGVVFHSGSTRCVTLHQAQAINAVLHHTKTKPVAVFTEHTATEMQLICEEGEFSIIQLQGQVSRSEHHLLSKDYRRIFAQSVNQEGQIKLDEGLRYCDPNRDYLLFDQANPGRGVAFDWQKFTYHGDFSWFLAGGLKPSNLRLATQQLQPTGLDVSSGVENALGQKDLVLIEQFIQEARK